MKQSRARGFLIAIAVIFLIVFAGGAWLAQRGLFQIVRELGTVTDLDAPASEGGDARRFVVQPGDTATSIGERLQAAGLVRSALAFRTLARSLAVESQLGAGEYELRPSMRPSEIMQAMRPRGGEEGVKVTFPEGWRTAEMADRLEASGTISRTEFLRAARSRDFGYPFLSDRPAGSSLEGYLFPDTYIFTKAMTATTVLDTMLRNFDRRFDMSLRQRAERQGLSLAQVVILASIVEREAVIPEERSMIAEVFLNRLALKMPLQADPTVQYAVAGADGDASRGRGYWKRDLSVDDLRVESPYNTYQNRGLPPGAICNPGLAAIKAVVAPTSTGYLYFVAKPDGAHAFARSLEEHNENVAQYRDLRGAR